MVGVRVKIPLHLLPRQAVDQCGDRVLYPHAVLFEDADVFFGAESGLKRGIAERLPLFISQSALIQCGDYIPFLHPGGVLLESPLDQRRGDFVEDQSAPGFFIAYRRNAPDKFPLDRAFMPPALDLL